VENQRDWPRSPEETELEIKRSQLEDLRIRLAIAEEELATAFAQVRAFEGLYIASVGVHLAQLDEIEALIAEATARRYPQDTVAAERARVFRARATESATVGSGDSNLARRFRPKDSLKSLYREVAKAVHPDLATDDEDRKQRALLMAFANAAYEKGDERRLREILGEWRSNPEAVRGDGTAAELVRTIRRIAQASRRIEAAQKELAEVQQTDLWALLVRVEADEARDIDTLGEMAHLARDRVALARQRLDALRQQPLYDT